MVLMENSQTQGRLAEELMAERAFLSGEDLGPGGGPGARYQSPGLPCSSCSAFRSSVVSRRQIVPVCTFLVYCVASETCSDVDSVIFYLRCTRLWRYLP